MKMIAFVASAFALLSTAPARVHSTAAGHQLSTPIGDVAFEVVGQVTNPTPSTSNQYGYVTSIKGLSAEQIFTVADPATQNEMTALFTFFTDATTERVIANGRLRIINRVGKTTIYLDEVPDGTFADPLSFRNGQPILTLNYRQQVVLDAVDGTFTVVNLLTATDVETFAVGGEPLRLGKRRDQFRQFYSGAPPAGTPALAGVFGGYAVAIEPAERERR